jgi:hypothetical protein
VASKTVFFDLKKGAAFSTEIKYALYILPEPLQVFMEIPGEASATSSPAGILASRVNAARELGRSVYLGYWRSAYFREGWVLLLMRVLAVVLPGLPFHRVHDYVNAVALAAHIPKDE